ncbi:MAG: aspartate carbamoyltransferase [Chlamydiota bacterium]
MKQTFAGRDILAIDDLSKTDILEILETAKELEHNPKKKSLEGHILGSCFFEPSTRTRLSFESAMQRLGGQVMGFADDKATAIQKGESLRDTMKVLENYVDLIVMRHPLEGSAQLAADSIDIPVINAGDGANEHPTQTLLDLFTIQKTQDRLDNLSIAMVGDLRYGRTTHSLARAAVHFGMRLYFVAPQSLEMPKEVCNFLRDNKIKFSFHRSIDEVLHKVDILYLTRIQEERFTDKQEYLRLKDQYILTASDLEHVKENLRILHPLPRNEEVDRSVDKTPYASYFSQANNGLVVRQALLRLVLGQN